MFYCDTIKDGFYEDKMKNLICFLFGCDFEIHCNSEEMWIECNRCSAQEDVPENREDEAYMKIGKRNFKWEK